MKASTDLSSLHAFLSPQAWLTQPLFFLSPWCLYHCLTACLWTFKVTLCSSVCVCMCVCKPLFVSSVIIYEWGWIQSKVSCMKQQCSVRGHACTHVFMWKIIKEKGGRQSQCMCAVCLFLSLLIKRPDQSQRLRSLHVIWVQLDNQEGSKESWVWLEVPPQTKWALTQVCVSTCSFLMHT